MPGYKSLPSSVNAPGAEEARKAESTYRDGNAAEAAQLLEEALEASLARDPVLPGWLCGRLAALYRTLDRYDDEVFLLERYRESQVSEEARTRYDARLSKARIIASRKRKPDCNGALNSVRAVMQGPRRSQRARRKTVTTPPASVFSPAAAQAITRALSGNDDELSTMTDAVTLLCAEAHARDIPAEAIVALLRNTRAALATRVPNVQERYDSALMLVLADYYAHA